MTACDATYEAMLAISLETRNRLLRVINDNHFRTQRPQVQGHVSVPRGIQADTRALRVRQQRTRHVPPKGTYMGGGGRRAEPGPQAAGAHGGRGRRDRVGTAKKVHGIGHMGSDMDPPCPRSEAAGCLWNHYSEEFSRRSASLRCQRSTT